MTLSPIPLITLDTAKQWPFVHAEARPDQLHALIRAAVPAYAPRAMVRLADRSSEKWLARNSSPYIPEVHQINSLAGNPGCVHVLTACYEWGCTAGALPYDGSMVLFRVLDWPFHGLGRLIEAVVVPARPGPFITLTWPGFTGVLQALAPGRFAVALNQAPLVLHGPKSMWFASWVTERRVTYASTAPSPLHVVRMVCEEAGDFATARDMLEHTDISTPATYTLVGMHEGERSIIERSRTSSFTHADAYTAANAWRRPDVRGLPRHMANTERAAQLMHMRPDDPQDIESWLRPPMRNCFSRLALSCSPREGWIVAQDLEGGRAATEVFRWHM